MRFNSLVFLVFAGLFFLCWRAVPPARRHRRWGLLVIASSVFYGWWDWRFLFLLAGTGLVDFLSALLMVRWPARKKLLLTISLLSNLAVLGTFKYLGFFARSLNAGLHLMSPGWQVPVIDLILPVGISFYTFQSMSYTIDVYRGDLRPTRDPLHFFAMISLFPHLVAGPVLRARTILPQLAEMSGPTEAQRWAGMKLIVCGYFKKVVLADNLAPVVNHAFAASAVLPSASYWWIIITMFAMQIYCDFSGYTDIARGLAKWMGIEFPLNFDHPYLASSFRDFWKRWHISLSSWWMEYVYIPLGGSRKGTLRAHVNLWITMLVSGLWHGAAWTFVGWGALHAAFLSAERVTRWPLRMVTWRGGRFLVSVALLAQVWVAWAFFRARSLSQALAIAAAMLDVRHADVSSVLAIGKLNLCFLLVAVLAEVALWSAPTWWPRVAARPRGWTRAEPVFLAAAAAACVYFQGPGSAFIYFQF